MPRTQIIDGAAFEPEPGLAHGRSRLVPVQVRATAGGRPAGSEFALQCLVPASVRIGTPGVGAVAVGRPEVAEREFAPVAGVVPLGGEETVGVGVGAVGAVGTDPAIARGVAGIVPAQPRVAASGGPAALELAVERAVPGSADQVAPALRAIAVGRQVVAFVVEFRTCIRTITETF